MNVKFEMITSERMYKWNLVKINAICDTLRSTKSESMYVSRPFYEQRHLSPIESSNMFRWKPPDD
jgi:hypothetical protein